MARREKYRGITGVGGYGKEVGCILDLLWLGEGALDSVEEH